MRIIFIATAIALSPIAATGSETPSSAVFHDPSTGASCGPVGQSGSADPDLNRLKNRIQATPETVPKTVAFLRNLPNHVKEPRSQWSSDDLKQYGEFESTQIRIVGYFVGVRAERAESTNCGATDRDGVDFHTWVVDSADQDRTFAAVMEVAPRWRQVNSAWTVAAIQALVEQGAQVRLSGWPMFDQEHPEQLGKTRSTLWEIHPITSIEVATSGGWVDLGDNDALKAIRNTAAITVRLSPGVQSMFPATATLLPQLSPPSDRARRFGPLHLVHTRKPAITARIIKEEKELFRQEADLGE
jgi:hypothetical protein